MIPFLIFLIFFSKISFHFLPFVPYQLSNIIFQYGIHPYVNILLCFCVGGIILFRRLLKLKMPLVYQLKTYHFILFFISSYLLAVTLLQIVFNQTSTSVLMSLLAALISVFTLFLFGRYIPTEINPEDFVISVQKITTFFCWTSLLFLFLSPATSFHGGRFIGVFKHIPHMVTTATVCFVFTLYNLFCLPLSSAKKYFFYLTLLCSFGLLVLTGTRSALISLLMCLTLSIILFRKNSASFSWLKSSVLLTAVLSLIFFSQDLSNYVVGVLTGEQAIGLRAAQNGVSSRWDEVLRGIDIYNKNPWIGQGLLSKFGDSEAGEVGSYNANNDPHNILISAGVIGGAGFIFVILISYMGLVVLSVKSLGSANKAVKILAIYMCSQLPIIFIYHMHLSIGGIADRMYWLVIGFLAINGQRLLSSQIEKKL